MHKMIHSNEYEPGPARGAQLIKGDEKWTLLLIRELRHSPEKVWQALTDPKHLREWAPFDADATLAHAGQKVQLSTVAAPKPQVSESTITLADPPHLLEYNWGDQKLRWQLDGDEDGTRLTLWHDIDRRFIAIGAAGWHICIDVMDRSLGSHPL